MHNDLPRDSHSDPARESEKTGKDMAQLDMNNEKGSEQTDTQATKNESPIDSELNSSRVFPMDELSRVKKTRNGDRGPIRIKTEFACSEPLRSQLQTAVDSQLESYGCRVVGDNKPDWVLSIIAYSHGSLVELSIVLRRLFRSTLPGTEIQGLDSEQRVILRQGGWLYESLRFHGLYGVLTGDLEGFCEKLVRDFAWEYWNRGLRKRIDHGS